MTVEARSKYVIFQPPLKDHLFLLPKNVYEFLYMSLFHVLLGWSNQGTYISKNRFQCRIIIIMFYIIYYIIYYIIIQLIIYTNFIHCKCIHFTFSRLSDNFHFC
jgi:hypothetical protein